MKQVKRLEQYKHYVSKVKCSNCRNVLKIRIPRGIRIEKHRCPVCGLNELHSLEYFGIKPYSIESNTTK